MSTMHYAGEYRKDYNIFSNCFTLGLKDKELEDKFEKHNNRSTVSFQKKLDLYVVLECFHTMLLIILNKYECNNPSFEFEKKQIIFNCGCTIYPFSMILLAVLFLNKNYNKALLNQAYLILSFIVYYLNTVFLLFVVNLVISDEIFTRLSLLIYTIMGVIMLAYFCIFDDYFLRLFFVSWFGYISLFLIYWHWKSIVEIRYLVSLNTFNTMFLLICYFFEKNRKHDFYKYNALNRKNNLTYMILNSMQHGILIVDMQYKKIRYINDFVKKFSELIPHRNLTLIEQKALEMNMNMNKRYLTNDKSGSNSNSDDDRTLNQIANIHNQEQTIEILDQKEIIHIRKTRCKGRVKEVKIKTKIVSTITCTQIQEIQEGPIIETEIGIKTYERVILKYNIFRHLVETNPKLNEKVKASFKDKSFIEILENFQEVYVSKIGEVEENKQMIYKQGIYIGHMYLREEESKIFCYFQIHIHAINDGDKVCFELILTDVTETIAIDYSK